MAFNVRIFGHRGLQQIPVNKPTQFSSDSVMQVTQPYEFSQVLSVSGAATPSAPVADANSGSQVNVLLVQVPDGETVRYEINPPGRSIAASTNSPAMSGQNYFYFKSGWSISLIDAAALP